MIKQFYWILKMTHIIEKVMKNYLRSAFKIIMAIRYRIVIFKRNCINKIIDIRWLSLIIWPSNWIESLKWLSL